MVKSWLQEYLRRHEEMVQSLDLDAVASVIKVLADARDREARVFVCGNGGSAATASHLSVDLGKGASLGRSRRFKVISLNENVAWMTALANDTGYENVFAEQMANQARAGDVLVAVSVSGNSPNVVKALEQASGLGMTTVALTGRRGGRAAELADHVLRIDSDHFGHCEDGQMLICHLLGYAFMEVEGL